MRDVLKSTVRRLSVGWFWPLVLLALPNCSFAPGISSSSGPNLQPRPDWWSLARTGAADHVIALRERNRGAAGPDKAMRPFR